jgi:hypothetical protein
MKVAWLGVVAACSGGDDGGISDAAQAATTSAGLVLVSSEQASNSTGGSGYASFAPRLDCAVTAVGPCQVIPACTGSTTAVSAGTVAISGLGAAIALSPDGNNRYLSTVSTGQPIFVGGEHLTATVTGATAPGFSATLTAPTRPTVTSPSAPAAGGQLALARSSDFAVHWTGGSAQVWVTLVSAHTTLVCSFDASAGSGTIPAAIMGMLDAGSGSFGASSFATSEMIVGDYDMRFEASFSAVFAESGALATAAVILQ